MAVFFKDDNVGRQAEEASKRLRTRIAAQVAKTTTSLRVEPQMLDDLQRAAKATRLKKSQIVRDAVARHLKRLAKEQAEAAKD